MSDTPFPVGKPSPLYVIHDEDILFYYDRPLMYYLNHETGRYLLTLVDEEPEDRYLATRISPEAERAFNEGRLSIRGAFLSGPCFDFRVGFDSESGEWFTTRCSVFDGTPPEEMLTKPGLGMEVGAVGLPDTLGPIPDD